MPGYKAELKAKPAVREARGQAPVVTWANQDEFKEIASEPVNPAQTVGAWLQQVILKGEFKVHEGACDADGDKFDCHFILAPLPVPFSSPSGGDEKVRILEGVVAEASHFARLRVSDAKEFSIEKMNGEDVLVIGDLEEVQAREQSRSGGEAERGAGAGGGPEVHPAAESAGPG